MTEASTSLSFGQFTEMLERELGLNGALINPATALEETDLDSIGMYELVLLVEDYVSEVSEQALMGWVTFGDVYDYFRAHLSGRRFD